MAKIVITGGIACGKTLFCAYLSEAGFDILDCDYVVHALEAPGGAAVTPIRQTFGDSVIGVDGSVDRAALGKIVFSDSRELAKLNAIVHPLVESRVDEWLAGRRLGMPVVVIPLLFELGWQDKYDCVVALVCDKELQLKRLMERRGCTLAEAEARVAAQLPASVKAERAHIVVENNGGAEALKSEVERVAALLKKRYG
jgi:dephospho-CoA kinase